MKNKFKYKIRIIIMLLILIILNLGLIINSTYEENTLNLLLDEEGCPNKISSNQYIHVIAKDGDTIWNIVKNNYEDIEKSKNVKFRDVIAATVDLNGGSNIKIGQVVLLPKNAK